MIHYILTLLLLFSPLQLLEPVPRTPEVQVALTFEQFFRAISEQESGGNYKAVGVMTRYGRAYGKYQILESNIYSWSQALLGRRVSLNEYLNNPSVQEELARRKLQSYWNKYGARGAAAAWYSGDPKLHNSTASQHGGPSIKGYVDQVLAKAAKYPAGGSGDPGGGGGTGAVQSKTRGETAESYGFVEAMLNANPELKALFDKAVRDGWTPQRFQAAVRDTKWFKTHSESERQFIIQQYGDPKTAREKLDQAYVHVRQFANQLGVPEDAGMLKKFSEWAYKVVALGWDDGRLREEVGKWLNYSQGIRLGEGGEVQDKIRSYAWDMGVVMSEQWYADNTRAVVRGISTMQDLEDAIRRQARSVYSNWQKEIDNGQSVRDLASPYLQTMANILELPPGSVNLFNPTIKKALQYKDPQTGENSVKQLWQFENELRNDDRWLKTKNAQDSIMQVAHQVLADFGFKY